jgi:hypothetical protein
MTEGLAWNRQINRVHTTYIVEYSWDGIQGYTTLLPTITDIIRGQMNNTDITIIAQLNSKTADLKTAIGQHFSKDTSSFYLTADGSSLMYSERIRPRKSISIIPQLWGGTGTKRRSVRPPAFEFMTEITEVRTLLQRTMDLQIPPPRLNGKYSDRRGLPRGLGRFAEVDTTHEGKSSSGIQTNATDRRSSTEETDKGDTNRPQYNASRLHTLPSQFTVHTMALLPPAMSSHDYARGTMSQPDPGI